VRLFLLGLGVLAVTMLVAAPRVDAMRVKIGGRVYGVMPNRGALAGATHESAGVLPALTSVAAPAGNVNYQGGPVLHSAAPYVIYWDPTGTGITARSEQVIDQYLTDVSTDSGETDDTYGVGRQYYDSAGIADSAQRFSASSQALVDADAYPVQDTVNCPTESGFTACITDAQITAELSAFIAANQLPTDGLDTEAEFPAFAPVYFMVLPATVDTCVDTTHCSGGPSSGPQATFSYCAYHSDYTDSGSYVLYSDIPFSVFTENPIKGCQADNPANTVLQAPNGDPADNILDNLSHELNETITDPLGTGWYSNGTGNEVADNCEAYGSSPDPADGLSPNAYEPTLGGSAPAGTLYDQLINGDQYYTQSLWSNGQADCELHPTAATLTPAFSVSGAMPGSAATIDPTSTVAQAGVASATWNWGDGTTSLLPGSLTTTTHTFAADGIYEVTLTVVDGNGNLASVRKEVSVGSNPKAVIGMRPTVATVGSVISFSGSSSTDPNGTAIANFNWDFGDGNTDTGVSANHAYARTGVYTVTLGVNDSYGFAASTTANIDILAVARINKVSDQHSRTSAYVLVKVTQAGSLTYAGRSTKFAGAGTVKIRLKLTATQTRMLKQGHKFTLTIRLVYKPRAGRQVTKSQSLRL
jgi:PKD repeat protein